MRLVLSVLVAVVVAGCSGSVASGVPSAANPTPSAAPATQPVVPSPGATGPCLDRADFADSAEVVVTLMQSLVADLSAADAVKAKTDAATLSTDLRQLADRVDPVHAEAAKGFRAAADEVDGAVPQFPGGQSAIGKAQTDVSAALVLVQTAYCA